ncbi:MAG: VOC family protein [Hyphomicrobiales bacterium]|nr:VOC family protein [Hyphomicrobiales bacterium]
MSSIQAGDETRTDIAAQKSDTDLKLEVVVIPVADVERAKHFYGGLGWRLDADFVSGDDFRVVQFTPPGSPCSTHFGKRVTQAAPGSVQGLYLIVSDILAARAELIARGAAVSEIIHRTGPGTAALDGPHPERRSYASFASFSDPDGNSWLLQEVTTRLPGRVDTDTAFASSSELAAALRRAAAAHGEHEKRIGGADANWPDWYATYMIAERSGRDLPV